MKKLLTGILVMMVVLTACTKDDSPGTDPPPPPPPPTVQDTLLGWKYVNMGQTGFSDVWFTSKQTGLLLTRGGIFRTTNEGVNWTKTDDGPNYANLFFLDAQYGYAQGSYDFAYTTNGGVTWTTHPNVLQALNNYHDVFFTTPSTGYVTAREGLFKSIDTGKTWQQIRTGDHNGIYFSNPDNGWVFNANKMYKTTNGGATWQFVSNVQATALLIATLQFTDALHAKYCAETLFGRSDDGGLTWTTKEFSQRILDIHFLNNNDGYLTTITEIFKTTDGGITWTRSSKPGGEIVEIFFSDVNNGWACGQDNKLLQLKQ